MILKIILFMLLISHGACSRTSSYKMFGEWTIEICKYGDWYPILIIFRSDNKYLVFNDRDFTGILDTTAQFNIITDDQTVTALIETGRWTYDRAGNQLLLTDRNFIKEYSMFNDNEYYGRGEKLILKVKHLTDEKVVLCFDGRCDTYFRNYSPRGFRDIFYRELTEEFTGIGSQTKEIQLSAYETELKLSYDFGKDADQLIIEDRSGRQLFATGMIPTNGKRTQEISLRGITKLVLKVTSSQESSEWTIKAEIK